MLGNQHWGVGGGGIGVGVVSTVVIYLCRRLSVNHVEHHPRADHYFRRQPGVSHSLSRFSHRLCVVSFACAVPSWDRSRRMCPPCSADRRRAPGLRPRGQYRGEGPARLTCRVVGAVALAVRSGAFMVGFFNGRVASLRIGSCVYQDIKNRNLRHISLASVLLFFPTPVHREGSLRD